MCKSNCVFWNRQSLTFLGKVHFVLEFCKISPRKGPGIQRSKVPRPSRQVVVGNPTTTTCCQHFNASPCLNQTFFDNLVTMCSPRLSKLMSKLIVEAGSMQCSRPPKSNEPKTIRNSTRASSLKKPHHQNPAAHLLGYSTCYTQIPAKA